MTGIGTKGHDSHDGWEAMTFRAPILRSLTERASNDPQRMRARKTEAKIMERGVADSEGIYKVCQAYAVLGDTASALRMFRQTIAGGFFCYPYFQKDPLIDSIRSQAEFAALMDQARRRHEAFKAKFSAAAQWKEP